MSKKSKRKKKSKNADPAVDTNGQQGKTPAEKPKLKNKEYEADLFKLQVELVKLQEWAKKSGARIVIVFEGRDAAARAASLTCFGARWPACLPAGRLTSSY